MLSRRLSNQVKLGLTRYPYSNVPDLLEDCVRTAVDAHHRPTPAGRPGTTRRTPGCGSAARAELPGRTVEVVTAVEKVVAAAHDVRTALAGPVAPALAAAVEDMRAQLFGLIRPGFVGAAGVRHLPDLPRYLRGDRPSAGEAARPTRPATGSWMDEVLDVRAEYDELLAALPPQRRDDADVTRDPLDDRGAAGQPVRAGAAHALSRVAGAHPTGDGRDRLTACKVPL